MIDMVGRKEASKGSLRETGPRQQFQVMIRTLQCLKRDAESHDPSDQLSQAEPLSILTSDISPTQIMVMQDLLFRLTGCQHF